MVHKTASVIKKLRTAMQNSAFVAEQLNAYLIPSEDAHLSEYVAECDQRRAYISGFTGSRGLAAVTDRKAAMWTDGRYFLQAEKEMNEHEWILMKEGIDGTPTLADWLSCELPAGSRVGVDPQLISASYFVDLSKQLYNGDLSLVPVNQNLVDIIWEGRPQRPTDPIHFLPNKFVGVSWQEKVASVRQLLVKSKTCLLCLSALDEIAWLFNLRGSDVPFNPVFFAYAFIGADICTLLIDDCKLTVEVKQHLKGVEIKPYTSVLECLDLYRNQLNGKIWLPDDASYALELNGMRRAHVKDAVAHCEFLYWLENEIKHGKRNLTEIDAALKFEEFRRQQDDYVGLSFGTISASDSNGSICHYKPEPETNATITSDSVYLVDSGAHYLDGTTDVTRTVCFKLPADYQRECFTRVLKGHIALAKLSFPEMTNGIRMDCFARACLWNVGLDYMHGTGHGVGHYLNVHEGPAGFHFRASGSVSESIHENMVLTIEPGYYEDGRFGIRIENVYAVVPANPKYSYKNKKFFKFEPLTLVPIQREFLDAALLNEEEISWLNEYHELCLDKIGAELNKQGKRNVQKWLVEQTKALG